MLTGLVLSPVRKMLLRIACLAGSPATQDNRRAIAKLDQPLWNTKKGWLLLKTESFSIWSPSTINSKLFIFFDKKEYVDCNKRRREVDLALYQSIQFNDDAPEG